MSHKSLVMRGHSILKCVVVAACLAAVVPVDGQSGAAGGEWRHYGADAGSTKYSPLSQISKDR